MPIDPSPPSDATRHSTSPATSPAIGSTTGGTPMDLLGNVPGLAVDPVARQGTAGEHDVPRKAPPMHARTRRPHVLLLVASGLGLWTAGLWAGLRVAGNQNRSADLAGTRASFTTELSPATGDSPTSVTSVFGGGPVGEALRLHRAAVDRARNQPRPGPGTTSPTSTPVDPAARPRAVQALRKGD